MSETRIDRLLDQIETDTTAILHRVRRMPSTKAMVLICAAAAALTVGACLLAFALSGAS